VTEPVAVAGFDFAGGKVGGDEKTFVDKFSR
jgi:hypothetical protein